MGVIEDYVARIEETCGEEKNFIVVFKYDKKEEVIAKIIKRSNVMSTSPLIYELVFKNVSFRVYGTGKAIFRGIKNKSELLSVLAELLL